MNHDEVMAVCLSHIGKRPNHEDNFLFNGKWISSNLQAQMLKQRMVCLAAERSARVQFFAISDGMGGHNAGEVASRISVERLSEAEKVAENCLSLYDAVNIVQAAIADLNDYICNMSHKNTNLRGMGATLVLLIVCNSQYAILNIGDSCAYYFGEGKLQKITKDHTEGQRILDLGLLSRKELLTFPARKNLNRYIGYDAPGYALQADVFSPEIDEGILLLCSDGLTDAVSEKTIKEVLDFEKGLYVAGKMLIKMAVTTNNADNVTIILVPLRR